MKPCGGPLSHPACANSKIFCAKPRGSGCYVAALGTPQVLAAATDGILLMNQAVNDPDLSDGRMIFINSSKLSSFTGFT
jgi:hypothetical protein